MAEKLRSYDFSQPSSLTASEKATYPWEQWLDGDIWQLVEGEDFHTHPLMMERIIRTRATTRGARVRMRHVASNGSGPFGTIILQRTDEASPAAQRKAEAARKRAAKKDGKAVEPATSKAGTKKAAPSKETVNGKTSSKAKTVAQGVSKRPTRKAPATAA